MSDPIIRRFVEYRFLGWHDAVGKRVLGYMLTHMNWETDGVGRWAVTATWEARPKWQPDMDVKLYRQAYQHAGFFRTLYTLALWCFGDRVKETRAITREDVRRTSDETHAEIMSLKEALDNW